jgi:hypothetical protein
MDHDELGSRWPWRTWPSFSARTTGGAWPAASPAAPQVGAGTGRQGRHTSSGDTARPPSARSLSEGPGEQPRRQPCW